MSLPTDQSDFESTPKPRINPRFTTNQLSTIPTEQREPLQQYRVFAIDQNDDASYGSSITPPVTVGSSIPTTPTSLTWLVVGSNLQLSWPSAYTGWELQSQTNSTGLGTNWGTVPNSSSTNQIVVPINPLSRSVFYRLYYSP